MLRRFGSRRDGAARPRIESTGDEFLLPVNKTLFYLSRLTQVLWLRASLFAVAAVAAALLAQVIGPHVPEPFLGVVSEETVQELLKIIASSMLAVTTFSLATVVAAYDSVTSSASPRAAGLLLDNKSAQNALSSFIAAFIFSVVAMIVLGSGFYGPDARFVLFLETMAVLAFVVVRLLAWIDQLSRLGRVGSAIDQVEQQTRQALERRRAFLGGAPGGHPPPEATAITAPTVGYVQHVDIPRLQKLADRQGFVVHLAVLPGSFLRLSRPVMRIEGASSLDERVKAELLSAVVLGGSRTFQQDPRYGLVVLGEIASRALSPGVNDPGTAIDVIGTAVRVLSLWADDHWERRPDVRYPRVHVPPLSAGDCFQDVFGPISRDGAGMLEVGIALQKGLRDLEEARAEGFAEAARSQAELALLRAERALPLRQDVETLRRAAATED